MTLSTHVLDAVTGRPAAGMDITLSGAGGEPVATRTTDDDGRVPDLAADLPVGVYRLVFRTGAYLGPDSFFPEVCVTIRVTDPAAHLHVPLLLSPYAYSTYRGS